MQLGSSLPVHLHMPLSICFRSTALATYHIPVLGKVAHWEEQSVHCYSDEDIVEVTSEMKLRDVERSRTDEFDNCNARFMGWRLRLNSDFELAVIDWSYIASVIIQVRHQARRLS